MVEKKIFLDKEDKIDTVLQELQNAKVEFVVFNIPRDSLLGKGIENFEKLKKESEILKKEVVVESVDEHILELAAVAGFKALNPVFRKSKRPVADILPRSATAGRQVVPSREKRLEEISIPKREIFIEEEKEEKEIKREKIRKPVNWRLIWRVGLVMGVVGVLVAAALIFLPRADIAISLNKSPLDFEQAVEARKDVFEISLKNGKIAIPAEFLTASKNIEMTFPATDRKKVELKAEGELTVYNSFSSDSQALVANTRFLSPEGKIFRLDKQIVVPGAKVVDGQIVPSSITVDVTADKAGEEFNLEKSSGKWRIPGFTGSPKYEKFYAEAVGAFTGGFIGEKAVPTPDDVTQGKQKIEQTLRDVLKSQMLAVEENLRFLNEATLFKLNKVEVNETADENNLFRIFGEAEMRQIGFNENILREALLNKLKPPLEANLGYGLNQKSFEFSYQGAAADFENGVLAFNVKGNIVFVFPFNIGDFKKEILGFDETELRSRTAGIPGLEKARIAFWPFWVHQVPSRENRILITVE